MVRKYSKKGAKRGMKGKKQYHSRPARPMKRASVPEWASLTEVWDSNNLPTVNTGTPYTIQDLHLAQFTRATQVAQGYQYFRIKRVKVIFTPLTDTFLNLNQAPGPTPNVTIPYLYYMINRANQIPTPFTADNLRAFGAKPRRLDDKTIVASYTPSVLNAAYDDAITAVPYVQYRMCPWLPTRDTTNLTSWIPSTIDHQGIVWIAENVSGATIEYKVMVEVEFQFKKPAVPFTVAPGAQPAVSFLSNTQL